MNAFRKRLLGFRKKVYCNSCQNNNDSEDILELACSHKCCKSCVLAAAIQALESESSEGMKCPVDPQCAHPSPISEDILEGLLEAGDIQKLKLLQSHSSSNPPCPKCESPSEAEKEMFYGHCISCDYIFCTKCRTDYHGFNCESSLDEEIMQKLRTLLELLVVIGNDPTLKDDGGEVENPDAGGDKADNTNDKTEGHFETPLLSCNICLDDFEPSLLVEFDCGHSSSCKPCVKTYFETLIVEGNVSELKCPQPDCGKEVSQKLVEENVEPRLFEKYDQLLLNKALSDFPEIVNCPKPSCQRRVVADPEYGYCEQCDFRFCTECSQPYHGFTGCGQTEEERRELIKRYIAADQEERDRLEMEAIGIRKKQNNDSESLIKNIYKKCPSCNASIEKIEGCNHMHCTKCGTHFCWLCGAKICASDPHEHFNHGRCGLFEVPPE